MMGQVEEGALHLMGQVDRLVFCPSVTNGRGVPLASLETLEIVPDLILPAKGLT